MYDNCIFDALIVKLFIIILIVLVMATIGILFYKT